MKKFGVLSLMLIGAMSLTSCGRSLTYEDYEKKIKGKVVTNISEEITDEETDKVYSVDYFTKTIKGPVTEVETEDGTIKTRISETITYKRDDGYRITTYLHNYDNETSEMMRDILYDIKNATKEEAEENEEIYYITKYEYDAADKLYSYIGEKNILLKDTPIEEQVTGELYKALFGEKESVGLVKETKNTFYNEVLSYGDINNITNSNFRSLSDNLLSEKLAYNAFVDGKQYILETKLSTVDAFDLTLDNFLNLFAKNKYFITDATIDGILGYVCEYDLKAIYTENVGGIFSKEVKELKAPTDEELKPTAPETK